MRFSNEHFLRIKRSSALRYSVSLAALSDHFDDKSLGQITSGPISEFEAARREAGVSNGTIRRDITCLAALFSACEEWEWFSGNPAAAYLKRAKKRGLVEAPPRTRYLSHEEEELVINYIAAKRATVKGNRDRHGYLMLGAAVILATDTGLREEELLGLEWPDVNLDNNEIKVTSKHAKSSYERRIPILPRSQEVLRRSKRSAFVLWHGEGERYRLLWLALQRAIVKIGLTDLRWHDLRRTCGCRLLQDQKMEMAEVSKWLGHRSITVTEKAYAFLDVRHLHAAVGTGPKAPRSPQTYFLPTQILDTIPDTGRIR